MPYLILKRLINFFYVKRTEQTHGLELRLEEPFIIIIIIIKLKKWETTQI